MNLSTPSSESSQSAIVAISSNPEVRDRMIRALESCDCSTLEAQGGAEILARLDSTGFDFAVLDARLPDLDSKEVARFIRQQNPNISYVTVDSASGKLVGPHQLSDQRARKVFQALKDAETSTETVISMDDEPVPFPSRKLEPLPGMVGQSEAFAHVHKMARIVARRTSTVLLQGESGVGKDMVAYAIHELSARSSGPLVIVNCAAIPENLLESELFGYARGAFTGAMQSRLGKIHAAHRGTLFLDEIGELPLSMQAKLLRFLQAGEVQRLGSSDVFQVDVRVIAATNANLIEKVAAGQFRQDLYYRLAVFPIHLPPLRDRVSEVLPLAKHFLAELCRTNSSPLKTLAPETEFALQEHDWPGNVRELKHAIERAFILSEDEPQLTREHLVFDTQKKLKKVPAQVV
ncbi:MAG TPA: sigma-54 dependent transcriptional regulator [Candidatus Angelobacter sp.]|nr:sigma-54 dependent transcriptional regulator [Candidatus Angelobacter sp.]